MPPQRPRPPCPTSHVLRRPLAAAIMALCTGSAAAASAAITNRVPIDGGTAARSASHPNAVAPRPRNTIKPNSIVVDGRTSTNVNVHGTHTTITTGTIHGNDAFNSFSQFQVGAGQQVDMYLPDDTQNLINLVTDSQAIINGGLSSFLSNGQVGGHVFFADPHGLVVGSQGTINVGALSVTTPTSGFMNKLLGVDGSVDDSALRLLLSGAAPLSKDGHISIFGHVYAQHGVTLRAHQVDASGVVWVTGGQDTTSGSGVNIQNMPQGAGMVEENGELRIVAAGDVNLSGVLHSGSSPTGIGSVDVGAGGDVHIGGSAQVDVSGHGENVDGGNIRIWADHDTSVASGAVLRATAGSSGDGGRIEVSAGHAETLNGGTFDASATRGKDGSVLFDPADLTISNQVFNPSGALYTATDSITVANGAVINTRQVAGGGDAMVDSSIGDSGDITLQAPKITIQSGGSLLAWADSGYKAGDVTLESSSSQTLVSGLASADSEIQIDGTIKGGNIEITADASAISDYNSVGDAIKTVANTVLPASITSAIGVNLPPAPFGVVIADSTATIHVGNGAQIEADGDLTLSATTDTQAKTTALNTFSATPVVAAGIFGYVTSDTKATIDNGATVSAGGNLTLKAINSNELEVSSSVSGDNGNVALSAVLGMADIDTSASIASGATIQKASNVVVLAHNANSFGIDASVEAADKGKAGLNAALAIIDTSASASSDANLGTTANPIQSLVVDASSVTEKTEVNAETAVGGASSGASPIEVVGDGGSSLPGFLEGKLSDYFTKADAATEGATGGSAGAEEPSALRLGSSVALVDSHQASTAKIGDDSVVHASGQVAVHAGVTSEGAHTSAAAETTSSQSDGNASKISISLAIGVGLYDNDAEAEIGNGASITAAQIGVGTGVEMPWNLSGITDYSNVPELLSTIYDDLKKNGAPLTTGYVNAMSDTGNVGVAGAVNFLSVNNTSKAWVGDGASLTSTAAADAPWSTSVDIMSDGGTPPKEITDDFDWSSAIDITADTTLQTITDAGNFNLLKLNGTGGTAGATSVGGGVNLLLTSNTTTAGIGADAVIMAPALAVDATTTNHLISVTPTAGHGSGISGNAIFAMADVDDATHASINGSTDVTADSVDVNASEGLGAWSIAGAVSQGSSVGVGIAIGVNHLNTDTSAYIGDNYADAPTDIAASTAPVAVGGTITTDDLKVQARTNGRSGAISVAAAAAASKSSGTGGGSGSGSSQFSLVGEKGPAFLDLTQNFMFNPSSETSGFTPTNVLSSLPLLAELFSKSESVEKTTSSGGGSKTQPKFGLGISGSASVNLTKLSTDAHVQGVTVDKKTDATSVTVNALNQTDLISASGAGALASAKNSSSKFNAGIAGAVAYSAIGNQTKAWLLDDAVNNAGDVAVQALSGGSEITLGLGLSVNTSGSGSTSISGAGSFSLSRIRNTTNSQVTNSTLTASTTNPGAMDVAAYDHTDIGAGGGSLAVGGKTGVGVAVTYADIGNTTSAALLGGSVDGFDSVSVAGLTASRIADGAATAQVGSNSNGLEGAFVVNLIHNTTSGNIGSHDAALTTVSNTHGAVNVTGSGTAPVAAYDARLTTDGQSDPLTALIDFSGTAIGANTSPGTAIFGVAGALGAGKNNIGLSAAYNQINNTFQAGISHATVSTDGAISVQAVDDTRIIGLAVGLGVASGSFAGMGSATANLINDTVSARIGDSQATSDTTSVAGSSVLVNAEDSSTIDTLAGAVALSTSGDAAGLSISFNEIGNQVDASIVHSTITGTGDSNDEVGGCSTDANANVAVQACSTGTINALSVGGAVSDGIALAGSLSINDIGLEDGTPLATLRETHTDADISGSSITAYSLGVRAADSADIKTLSGGIAAGAGDGSVGAAFSLNNMAANTHAMLTGSQLALDTGTVVKATSSGTIDSIAVGGAVSDGFAAAGSLTTNLIGNQTRAEANGLSGTTGAKATMQDLSLTAHNSSEINSMSGAVAIAAGDGAVGGGASTNIIADSTRATLTGSQLDVAASTTLDAKSTEAIKTLAVAVAGSGGIGLAGALTANSITGDVTARLGNSTLVDNANTTTISATGLPQIISSADSVGVGADAGGAAAVAVNHIGTSIQAELDGGTYHVADMTLNAGSSNPNSNGSANIQSLAAGVGGGSVGAAASIAVNVDTGSVTADITNGAKLIAQNNVGVLASNDQGINVLAGSLGVGIDAVGLGLGLIVNDIQGTTKAYIDGASTSVSALGKSMIGQLVNGGELANPDSVDISAIHAPSDYIDPDLSETQVGVTGLAVNAISTQHAATLGASASVAFDPFGSASLTMMAGVGVIGGHSEAYIEDASINQASGANADQQVSVIASHHAFSANFIAGISGGAGDFAGAGAVDVNTFNGHTDAHIGNATLSSKDSTTVKADASQRAASVVTGLAAAITGGAGTGIVNVFDDSTKAYVDKGSLSVRDLNVLANDTAGVSLNGGAAAFGAAGVAGSFLVNVGKTTTSAYVGDAASDTTVHVSDALNVEANSSTTSNSIAVSGSAGGTAVAGMAAVNVIDNDTNAYMDRAQLNQNVGENGTSSVKVNATETISMTPRTAAAALGFGGGAGGASANVIVLHSQVGSSIIDSNINALGGAVEVTADSNKFIDALTVSGALDPSAAISGAASVILFGQGSLAYQSQQTDSNGNSTNQNSDVNDEINKNGSGTLSSVNGFSSGSLLDSGSTSGTLSGQELSQVNDAGKVSLLDGNGNLNQGKDGTTATIVGSILDSHSLTLAATDTIAIVNHVGNAAGGGLLGAGGAVAFSQINDTVGANVDKDSVLTVDGLLNVQAKVKNGTVHDDVLGMDFSGIDTQAYQGAVGVVGLGAAVAISQLDNAVDASVAGSLKGSSSGDLELDAEDTSKLTSIAGGATGGGLAAGVVVAQGSKSSQVTAVVDAGTSALDFKTVKLTASNSGKLDVQGIGVSAGLAFAGNGADANATDSATVSSSIRNGAKVSAGSGGVTLDATDTPQLSARAIGVAVSGGAAVGASVATARVDSTVSTTVGDAAQVSGSGASALVLEATITPATGVPEVYAEADGGAGGVLFGANASYAAADNTATATASTGTGVQLPMGAVKLTATNITDQEATATGVGVGFVGVGASIAHASSDTHTTAELGQGNTETGARTGDLIVHATGSDTNHADTTAGSGGVVAGSAALADTGDTSTVRANIDGNNQLHADHVDIAAKHTTHFAATANAVGAGAASASGASTNNTANSIVSIQIAGGTKLYSKDQMAIAATNYFTDDNPDPAVKGGSGGVVAGAAAVNSTTLSGDTSVDIADSVILVAGLDASVAGALAADYDGYTYTSGSDPFAHRANLLIAAGTYLDVNDTVTLDSGGAVAGGGVKSTLDASHLDNAITLGDNDLLVANGALGIGTFTRANASQSALIHTYGGGAGGSATAKITIGTNQDIDVGSADTLLALGRINLTAGIDPSGFIATSVTGNSLAQAYVRGVIAVADGHADTNLTSTGHVNLGTGSVVLSGSDINFGVYESTPDAHADGTGHGYELGFVPVTNHDSNTSNNHNGNLLVDGILIAGIYNNNQVDIDTNGTLTHAHGAPLYYAYDPTFSPHDYIDTNAAALTQNTHHDGNTGAPIGSGASSPTPPAGVGPVGGPEGTNTSGTLPPPNSGGGVNTPDPDAVTIPGILKATTSAGPTPAYLLGSLIAAGGDVTLHGSSFAGSGSVTANGNPQINLTNASKDYLALGTVEIPSDSGGKVLFTGAAGADAVGSLSITGDNSSNTPTISIANTYPNVVKNASETITQGPAIFLNGSITNLSGLVDITNVKGSVGQFAPISAQQIKETVPNGAIAVYLPDGVYHSGNDPISTFAPFQINIGDANSAINYVANAMFNPDGGYNDDVIPFPGGSIPIGNLDFTSATLHQNGVQFTGGSPSGSAWVFLGQCMPYAGGSDCSEDTAQNYSPSGQAIGFHGIDFPMLKTVVLNKTMQDDQRTLSSSGTSALQAQTIAVVAKTIDIDSTISAGRPTNYAITINSNFGDFVNGLTATSGIVDVPSTYWSSNQTTVKGAPAQVRYDVTHHRIVVSNVNASGGGFVSLNGGIISTDTLGHIIVNDGYGHVAIDNNSGLQVEINNVNTGNNSLGQVKITDTNKHFIVGGQAVNQTHWYINQEGDKLRVYDNSNGSSTLTGAHLVSINNNDTVLTYKPQPGLRFQWIQQINLIRPIGSLPDGTVWRFADADGVASTNPAYIVTQAGVVQGAVDGPAFTESITGSAAWGKLGNSPYASVSHVYYHGCDDDGCHYGFPKTTDIDSDGSSGEAGVYEYVYPTTAQLVMTESVRADYTFHISFSGNSSGQVNINSNGSVLLNGTLYNPSGLTSIDASAGPNSLITAGTQGGIVTHDLTMKAGAGIGSAAQDLAIPVALTGGVLNLVSGGAGIDVEASTGVNVGTIQSGDNADWGNIRLKADGNIKAATPATRISGGSIDLASMIGAVGSQTSPLILEAHATVNPNASVTGGVVNVAALNGIYLKQTAGDLRVGAIGSTTGDVDIDVPNGSILDAAGVTSGQALSQAQLDKVKADLHLVDNAANRAAVIQNTIPALEHAVNSSYQRYWQLLDNGLVTNGVYSVKTAKIDLFRPLVSAALGKPATNADVQTYLADEFQSLIAFLADPSKVDPQATTQPDLINYDPTFKYVAPADQIAALTKDALFTGKQLVSAVNASALAAPGGTPVGSGTPNVTGRSISMHTGKDIGALQQGTSISYNDLVNGNLTDDQARALAAAVAPGDVTLVKDTSGKITKIDIQQTVPLFLSALDNVTAISAPGSGGSIFLQANGDLNLATISADSNARLIAVGNIIDTLTDPNQPVVSLGGNLTLLAGSSGSIGSAGTPLSYNIGGNLLAAVAGQDIYLRALGHDLTLGQISADGDVNLQAPDGGILATLPGLLAINAHNVTLDANGAIGLFGDPAGYLQVQVAPDGELDGTAGGFARLYSPSASTSLQVGSFTSDGLLDIVSNGDLTATSLTSTAGALNVAAGGDADLGAVESADAMTLNAVGNLQLTSATSHLSADNAVDADITINAGGSILANGKGSNGANLATAGAKGIKLRAGTGIGDPLFVDTAGIDADSDNGDIHIVDLRDLDHATLTADTGSVTLDVHGNATLANAKAGQDIDITANQSLNATMVDAGDTVNLLAGTSMTVGTVNSGADQTLMAHDDLTFKQLTSGANLIVTSSSGNILGGNANAAGAIMFKAGGDIGFDLLASGGDTTLTAAKMIDGKTLKAGGNALASSGADFILQLADIGNLLDFRSGGAMTLGNTTSGADQYLRSVSTLSFAQLTSSGGSIDAASTTSDILGGSLWAFDKVTLDAARDLVFDNLYAGQEVLLNAARNIHGGTVQSPHGSLMAAAGNDLYLDNLVIPQGSVDLVASGSVTLQNATLGHFLGITTAGDIQFDDLLAPDGIRMTSTHGSIIGTKFTADHGDFAAYDSIGLSSANVATYLNLAANKDITTNITQTQPDPELLLDVTGYKDGRAHTITLQVDTKVGMILDRLWGDYAHIRTTADHARIEDGRITNFMELETDMADIAMDNDSQQLRDVSVQLYQPDRPFMLDQTSKHTFTDAYVTNYQFPYSVEVPNYNRLQQTLAPDYKDGSAIRYSYRMLMLDLLGSPGFGNAPDVIDEDGNPVWTRPASHVVAPSTEGAVNTGVAAPH